MTFFDNLNKLLKRKQKTSNVAWLGLDFAGKTTLIKRITEGVFVKETTRTLGLNIDEYDSPNNRLKLVCWDIGGQEVFREHLWESYIKQSSGIIFVIDSSTPERFPEAKQELWRWVIENPTVKNIPILLLANKQDLPQAVDAGVIAKALDLHRIEGAISYSILPVSAATGQNIKDGLDWLEERLQERI